MFTPNLEEIEQLSFCIADGIQENGCIPAGTFGALLKALNVPDDCLITKFSIDKLQTGQGRIKLKILSFGSQITYSVTIRDGALDSIREIQEIEDVI